MVNQRFHGDTRTSGSFLVRVCTRSPPNREMLFFHGNILISSMSLRAVLIYLQQHNHKLSLNVYCKMRGEKLFNSTSIF